MKPRRDGLWLLAMGAGYVVLFTWFSYRRHMSYMEGEWDVGIFDQAFWTASFLGMPFYDTYEGMSHFGFHASPILLLVLPFYVLAPSTLTLFLAQSVALALGAVPTYLLGRDLIGPRSGLVFAALYLLSFPIHGINYHDFHETGFVVAPLLLALWGLRTGRSLPLWIGTLLALMCREDMGVLAFGMGLLGLWWRHRARRVETDDGPTFERVAPSLPDCLGLMVAGLAWTYIAFAVVLRRFRGAKDAFDANGDRFAHLGQGPLQWLLSPVLRPSAFWGMLLRKVSFDYVLGLLGPLAFLPLWAWPTLLVMLPVLVMNLVSKFGGMHLFTSHYAGPLMPFVFASAVEGAARLMHRRRLSDADGPRFLRPAVALTVLMMLLFDPSPLHVGWKVRPITDHARTLERIARSIPAAASVATLPNIWPHVTHRLDAWPHAQAGAAYVLIDRAPVSAQYMKEANLDTFDPVAAGYVLVEQADGVELYRLAPR